MLKIYLFDILNQTAEVGFRVGQKYVDRGRVWKALKILLESEVEEEMERGK